MYYFFWIGSAALGLISGFILGFMIKVVITKSKSGHLDRVDDGKVHV